MKITTILFLVGMALFAALSYLAKPISRKLHLNEIHVKVVGLLGCLIFAVLLFTLS